MSVVKGKRLGELQDIDHENFIYETNIIREKGGKDGWLIQREFYRYYGSVDLWTCPRMYLPITNYVYERINMVT